MKKKIIYVILLVPFLLSACQPAQTTQTGSVTIDPVELADFADKFFAKQMDKLDIPGVVFIFVQGDEVIYAKGYGYANLEQKTPMDAANTVVRIGSISKSFVATAVMQLVEQGKLDLHADVNQYLTAFQLEDTYPEPVTLAHLLTHTAGFEDPPYATSTDPDTLRPLREYLAANMPPRTHAPGEIYIYCSHGIDLAALIVEEVSGVPFVEYMEQNIFKPLDMEHTQYLLAPPMPKNLATGYFYEKGSFLQKNIQIPQPMDYDNSYPSGSMVSTASDMAHFLTAQLQGGCYNGVCILRPETIAQMHEAQVPTSREGQKATFGFVEWSLAGQPLLGHSGAIKGFGDMLEFFPDQGFGFFISFNEECWGTSACTIIQEFREQFAERFFR
jgi:CubicO group peptidase (beta-lactamase class C family)